MVKLMDSVIILYTILLNCCFYFYSLNQDTYIVKLHNDINVKIKRNLFVDLNYVRYFL